MSFKASNKDLNDIDVLCTFKIKTVLRFVTCVSKTNNNIQIKIEMSNTSQELPAYLKAPNKGLKEMYVICTFQIKSDNIQNMGVSKTSDHI